MFIEGTFISIQIISMKNEFYKNPITYLTNPILKSLKQILKVFSLDWMRKIIQKIKA